MSLSFGQAIIWYFLVPILTILFWLILVSVILSWLVNFNVVNARNQVVATIWRITSTVTEPLLAPIRRVLPPLGGFDLSPVVLILLIFFIRDWFLMQVVFPAL